MLTISSLTPLTELTQLSNQITALAKTSSRIIVAIAGPPGSGKSTLVAKLVETLEGAVVAPMDGFHLDNVILERQGLMPRKGSPASFDSQGYYQLISRLKYSKETVYAPVFDRSADLSRAGAIEISSDAKIVLTEGNYLLLEQPPWNQLDELFDLSVFLQVPDSILSERLTQRWLDQGLSVGHATVRAESNDLPNAMLVTQHSKKADVIIENF